MVDLVVLGSVAFDSIKTPFGSAEKTLGGSGTYAGLAASFFCKPGIVSAVGSDFPTEEIGFLKKKGIKIPIKTLSPFDPKKYKSGKLKKYIEGKICLRCQL